MSSNKPKVIKAYEKLDEAMQERIKLMYPYGFSDNLIRFTDRDGRIISALPFEAEDKYYLIKMSVKEAEQLIEDDDDYGDDGYLKNSVKEDYEDKHVNIDDVDEDDMTDD
jgi:hypothetical protein